MALTLLERGTVAPDFQLSSTPDQTVALSEFRGKNVVLAFYPADWSPVCGDELTVFNELLSLFHKRDTVILGISVDSSWCHVAFAQTRKLHFELLSDFEPKGRVSRLYGVYREKDGFSGRALYLIDAQGIIRWNHLSPIGVNPGADGVLDALEDLTSGKGERYVFPHQTQIFSLRH